MVEKLIISPLLGPKSQNDLISELFFFGFPGATFVGNSLSVIFIHEWDILNRDVNLWLLDLHKAIKSYLRVATMSYCEDYQLGLIDNLDLGNLLSNKIIIELKTNPGDTEEEIKYFELLNSVIEFSSKIL